MRARTPISLTAALLAVASTPLFAQSVAPGGRLVPSLTAGVAIAPSPGPIDRAKLVPADSAPFDNFGNDAALDGDRLLIGASTKRINGFNYAGAAYVYRRQGADWVEEAQLLALAPEIHDNFGTSVALQGDVAVVGAPDFPYSSFSGTGRVWVFRRTQGAWVREAELTGSQAGWDSGFGRDVALDGTTILVGAFSAGGRGAYAFEYNGSNWVETQRFPAGPTGLFGASVALRGDLALISDPYGSAGVIPYAGVVHAYVRTSGVWTQEALLTEASPQDHAFFGRPLAFDGTVAAIGASGSAEAFFFRRQTGTWTLEQRCKDPHPGLHADFPGSIAVDGETAIIGTPGLEYGAPYSGGALVYRNSAQGWLVEAPFVPRDSQADQGFGASVELRGSLAVIGSRVSTTNSASGAAYVIDVADRANGFALEVGPIPIQVAEDLEIRARGARPHETVALFMSLAGPGATAVGSVRTVLGLQAPSLVSPMVASSSGRADWALGVVPSSLAGVTLWYQAAQFGSRTAVVASTVL